MKNLKGIAGLGLFALFVVALVSCGKDGEKASLKFTPDKLSLLTGQTDTIRVSGGVAPYTVFSDDTVVAEVAADSNLIVVAGLKKGVTTVGVKDKNQLAGTISVVVDNPVVEFNVSEVMLFINGTAVVKIESGQSPFTISVADNSIATASLEDKQITIKGLKAGKTTVTVVDKDKVSFGKIAVTVR